MSVINRWQRKSVPWLWRWFTALAMVGVTSSLPAFQLVVIDPGHGGADSGTSWHGILEKTLTLDVAKRVETILRDNGVTTVMTRRYDKTISLDDRAIMANRFPNSLLVSVHFNAIRVASISGYETFYQSPVSKQVAQIVQKSIKETVPGIDRGITLQDFAVLVRTKGPAVLIECGFISNKEEADRCNTAAHRQLLAEAIARGVLRAKPIIGETPPEQPVAAPGPPPTPPSATPSSAPVPGPTPAPVPPPAATEGTAASGQPMPTPNPVPPAAEGTAPAPSAPVTPPTPAPKPPAAEPNVAAPPPAPPPTPPPAPSSEPPANPEPSAAQ